MKTQECLRDPSKLEKLGPGHYRCPEDHIHIYANEICEHLGIEPTEENLEMIIQLGREAVGESFPEVPVDILE